ncbi:MAG: hypothetical protein V4621_06505 [Pseudomonadota bacterium]
MFMQKIITPITLGFMMAVSANAEARDPQYAYRDIVYDGYMFNSNGCFPKARFGREKLGLDELETLKDTGVLPGTKVSLATIFGEDVPHDDAKERIADIQMELARAYRTLKNRSDCKLKQ